MTADYFDRRNDRSRIDDLRGGVDRGQQRQSIGTAKMLVQVYSGGAMPTGDLKAYFTHPVQVTVADTEGATPTYSVDTTRTIPVVFLGSTTPMVGDYAVAFNVGGVWAAERGTGGQCLCDCICVDTDMPGSMSLTISGNGVSYGPITLNPGLPGIPISTITYDPAYCQYSGYGTFTLPSTSQCPEVAGFIVVATVGYIDGKGWTLNVNFGAGSSGGAPFSVCGFNEQPLSCFVASDPFGGGVATFVYQLLLGSCPAVPFSFTGTMTAIASASGGFLSLEYLVLFFGGICTGDDTTSFDVTFAMTGSDVGAPPAALSGGVCQLFSVVGCGPNLSIAYPDVTVTVAIPGAATVASGVTNSVGQVNLSWPGSPGSYTVSVSGASSRFNAYSQTLPLACGGATKIVLAAADGYACSNNCLLPLATTLVGGPGSPFVWNGIAWQGTGATISVSLVFSEPGVSINPTTLDCPPSLEITYTIPGYAPFEVTE